MKRVASIAVVNRRKAILFLRRKDNGKWSMPGGHLNEGESPIDGAMRELWEETGIKASKSDLKFLGSGVIDNKLEVFSFEYNKKVPKVNFENDPDEEADDYCWFDEDSDSDYASGLPSNCHVPEGRNVTLLLMGRTPDEGKVELKRELVKMAIADIPKGTALKPRPDGTSRWDYSHVLSDYHRAKGLSLAVEHNENFTDEGPDLEVKLRIDRDERRGIAGFLVGNMACYVRMAPNGVPVVEPHSYLHTSHHKQGLGKAMYEALYAHAFHELGIKHVRGGPHSEAASRVHESLARKHGLTYNSEPRKQGLGPYEYTLKSEDFAKMAIKDLEPGEEFDTEGKYRGFDYSHLLPQKWQKHLALHVYPGNYMIHTRLIDLQDPDNNIGEIKAYYGGLGGQHHHKDRIEPHSDLMEEYHGEGLGKAMYEALYAHAYHKLGVKKIVGGHHTEQASRVHEALARKHGLNYQAKRARPWPSVSDVSMGPYEYELK